MPQDKEKQERMTDDKIKDACPDSLGRSLERNKEHEIDRIARELGASLKFYPGRDSTLNKLHGVIVLSMSVMQEDSGNELEAKDALLKKLQSIVCPDYSEAQHFRNHYREQAKELAEQISKARLEGAKRFFRWLSIRVPIKEDLSKIWLEYEAFVKEMERSAI